MEIDQAQWTATHGWDRPGRADSSSPAQLVLVFGSRACLEREPLMADVRHRHPGLLYLGCSTAGEIYGASVNDESLVVTSLHFGSTRVRGAAVPVSSAQDSAAAGARLADALEPAGLKHVFVLSDGTGVNGSELVRGLTARLPNGVTVTGGLSADGSDFKRTAVLWNDDVSSGMVAGVGFYGDRVDIGYASLGGWDPFGPERLITRSRGNVLYELDGKSALGLYKLYLGEHASGLPATGLHFPLSLRIDGRPGVVRTILSVDEAEQSLTFAGDVPEGSYARLMKANFDRLVDGATGAARACSATRHSPDVAILISCVGRKLILKQRVEDEVDGVREVFGQATPLTGFYSYGEISPFTPNDRCELHNQTMTITTISEW
ncbi:MAG: FIST signal transduction protein [Vicinamibacterales bacterium]